MTINHDTKIEEALKISKNINKLHKLKSILIQKDDLLSEMNTFVKLENKNNQDVRNNFQQSYNLRIVYIIRTISSLLTELLNVKEEDIDNRIKDSTKQLDDHFEQDSNGTN